MIIWGSKGRTKTVASGQFYCPRCSTLRPYEHRRVGKYFTLYFIPLFQTSALGEYVECQVCRTTFKVEVLEASGKLLEYERAQEQLKEAAKSLAMTLEGGCPVEALFETMKNNGASEELASKMVGLALGGSARECPNCHTHFASSLTYCALCGTSLSGADKL